MYHIVSKVSFLFLIDIESIWIGLKVAENEVTFSFFFFLFQLHYLTKSTVNIARMHCSWVPQIPLFSHFFLKNESYGTIHTFKKYFATMFSVSVKISSIQTDTQCQNSLRSPLCVYLFLKKKSYKLNHKVLKSNKLNLQFEK